jgi:hypothetical protein
VWIGSIDSGDFVSLPRAESFVGIEAPAAFKKALTAKNFVEAGDTAGKIVGGVEESCVGVGDFNAFA